MISRRPVDLVVSSVALQEDDLIWFQQQDIPVLILPRAQTFEELEANYLDLALAMSGQTSGATRGEEYYASLEEKLDDALALSQSWANAHDGRSSGRFSCGRWTTTWLRERPLKAAAGAHWFCQ